MLIKDVEDITTAQIEPVRWKLINAKCEMKATLDGINSKLDTTGKR